MTSTQTQALEYQPVDLFGGAIRASLPSTFADVSDIRQVPDNQEVYLDRDGFTSISIDILERVDARSDQEALKVHLQDVVGGDGEEDEEGRGANAVKVWQTAQAWFAKLPTGTPAYTLLATSPPGAKQVGRPNEPDFVGILLTLVRLEDKQTDLVVCVNVPHLAGQYVEDEVRMGEGKLGRLMERAVEIRRRLMETFEVREWDLFV